MQNIKYRTHVSSVSSTTGQFICGFESESASYDLLVNRTNALYKDINSSGYKKWGGFRQNWVEKQKRLGNTIHIRMEVVDVSGQLVIESNSIEDKITHILKNRSKLPVEKLDDLWDEVEQMYFETNHDDKEGLSQLIDRVEKKIA